MNFNIKFYPDSAENLKPWNASDEYLYKLTKEKFTSKKRMLIINDSNGFLSVNFAEYSPFVYSDSYINNFSIKENLLQNNLAKNVKLIDDLELIPPKTLFDLVLIKIPKSLQFLKFIVQKISPFLNSDSKIISAGMTKHLSSNLRSYLEENIGPTDITKVYKKSIAFISSLNKTEVSDKIEEVKEIKDDELNFTFCSSPNVFSHNKIDNGTRLLLKSLYDLNGNIADLGCGSGVIGLYIKKNFEQTDITLIDESRQAINSAKTTFKMNKLEARFLWSDGLKEIKNNSLDFVISNPPFHQENVINLTRSINLLKEVYSKLIKKGAFILVFNKHLGYESHLKKLFAEVILLNENKKFIVLKCTK